MQQRFVTLFNTQFANMRGTQIILFQTVFLNALFISLIHASNVTDHVHGQIAVRIFTETAFGHRNAFELKLLYRKASDFLLGQLGAYRNTVVRIAFSAQTVKAFDVRLSNRHDLLNFGDGLFEIILFFRDDFQGKARIITRQYKLVAIHNPASRRLDRHLRRAV